MTQDYNNSPHTSGRNLGAQRVCTLSGMNRARDGVVGLRALIDSINHSISDLEKQRRYDQMVVKAFLLLRFTKASCDAFIGMAAAMVDGTKAVEEGYQLFMPSAEALGAVVAGGKVDVVNTVTSTAKAGASAFVSKSGRLSAPEKEAYKLLINSAAVKVKIINQAVNQDQKGLFKTAASYAYDLHTTLTEMAAKRLSGRAATSTKAIGKFAKIAKMVFEYNEKLADAVTDLADAHSENEQRYYSMKRMLTNQARMISGQIGVLSRYVSSCEAELSADTLV